VEQTNKHTYGRTDGLTDRRIHHTGYMVGQ